MRILLLPLAVLLCGAQGRPGPSPARDPFALPTAASAAAAKPEAMPDLHTVSVYTLQWLGLLCYGERKMILLGTSDGRTQAVDARERIGIEQARVLALDEQALLLQIENGRPLRLRMAKPPQPLAPPLP